MIIIVVLDSAINFFFFDILGELIWVFYFGVQGKYRTQGYKFWNFSFKTVMGLKINGSI